MATSMPWLPFPFGPQVPITPPDHQSFPNAQVPLPLSPAVLDSLTREIYGNGKTAFGNGLDGGFANGFKTANYQARMMAHQRPAPGSVAAGVNGASKHMFPSPPPPPLQRPQYDKQQTKKSELMEGESAGIAVTSATAGTASTSAPSTSEQAAAGGPPTIGLATTAATAATSAAHPSSENPMSTSDPRYLVMASRIAAYYHQRCQAIANFQQQRCQAWANMQRQKSQEMTQAAMLVVAWYIRDRIQRRQRRGRRQFRRGLAAKAAIGNKTPNTRVTKGGSRGVAAGAADGRVTRGEAVRKWVLQIPEGSDVLSPNSPGVRDRPVDPDEVSFDIDRDTASDKDLRLYSVADNLIKSQLARIDVPMMGALSFEPSESETDSDEDGEEEDEADEDDEPVGPGGRDDEDDIMINYEERGAHLEAIAVGVDALATDVRAKAARGGLSAGAAVAVNGNKDVFMHGNNDNYDPEDEEEFEEDDDDYDEEDCCNSSHQVSDLAHHGTGAGSCGGHSCDQTASFA
ncbi:hypothetical protein SEPCBS57363_003788 [Sporothrix epigloea]|uniref:Uncharacterized protein n=1 Tax=Sporothrix epigloea TaxID=1892477 RepID=A0ABP0DNE0_9PEZI